MSNDDPYADGWERNSLGGYVWTGQCAAQLGAAGILKYLTPIAVTDRMITASAAPHHTLIIQQLLTDERFANGPLHRLHVDVGLNRRDFRAFRGALGTEHKGSLQVVIDEITGNFYADIDKWNPYEDAVSWLGHTFEDVLFKRNRQA